MSISKGTPPSPLMLHWYAEEENKKREIRTVDNERELRLIHR